MYHVENYEDGTQKMTNLKTGSCAYINPKLELLTDLRIAIQMQVSNLAAGVIMSSPDDEETLDLPPYGQGGLVDPEDID